MSLLLGAYSGALILGALAFQYLGGIAPCEICHWQRWPHIAAAVVGLGAGTLMAAGALDAKYARLVVILVIALIALSGALAVFHAGIEWKLWAGPSACTGARVEFNGLNGINDVGAVRCDLPQWRLFGISLAGYNALASLGAAAVAALYLARNR